MNNLTRNRLLWVPRLVAAAIMLQTLYFKFSGSQESVYIFSAIGAEPWGRIATGILELIASILLLIPATSVIGALLGTAIMGGALLTHLSTLGLVVMDDGGLLFGYNLLVLACCLIIILSKRSPISRILRTTKTPE